MAVLLCPLACASFATSNVSDVFPATGNNHVLLVWQVMYLVVAVVVIMVCKDRALSTLLAWFSCSGAAMYTILAWVGYGLLKNNESLGNGNSVTA
jgi:hypothetical protein